MMKVGTASSRMIPCLELPAPAHSPQLPGLYDNSGDAVKPMIIAIIGSGSLGGLA